MIRGMYSAASAMLSQLVKQEVHTHNLANANTTGFKRYVPHLTPDGSGPAQPGIVASPDLSPGGLHTTDAPLDVALCSDGFFVVDDGNARHYTRNGHFTLDSGGMLVNSQGHRVLGQQGPIHIQGSRVEIAADGAIHCDGEFVDKFLVVDFPAQTQAGLEANTGVIGSRAPAQVASYGVIQGAIEESNVNSITEMAAITSGYRVYEANARVISKIDDSLSKLIQASTG